jgi:hypothetical protein
MGKKRKFEGYTHPTFISFPVHTGTSVDSYLKIKEFFQTKNRVEVYE